MGQQTGVILPPTATNPRLESLQEDGKSPAIVVLCVFRRLALLWGRSACVAPVSACVQAAGASGNQRYCDGRPGPASPTAPTSATKSAQSRRVPSRPSWISIGLAAIGAAIGSATIWQRQRCGILAATSRPPFELRRTLGAPCTANMGQTVPTSSSTRNVQSISARGRNRCSAVGFCMGPICRRERMQQGVRYWRAFRAAGQRSARFLSTA